MTGLPDPGASRAVLIGVSKYNEHLTPLGAVAKNLDGLKEFLTGPDSWSLHPDHCVVMHNPKSAADVLDVVHTASTEATDALLVYFAGHGLLSPATDLYLALTDSHAGRLFRALDYDHLRYQVAEECAARSRVVILDCCYSARALHGYMGTPVELADCGGIDGTYVMTASSETKRAMAPKGEDYTAFTGALLTALTKGVPDGPELLDTESIYRHLRRQLQAARRPVPQQRARNEGHRIVLGRNRWSPAPGPEAEAYAAELRIAATSAAAQSIMQEGDGGRYLRGERVAPREFVDALADSLPPDQSERLHTLRRAAQRASPDAATQLLYWLEEVTLLQRRMAHAGRYSHRIEAELAAAQERARLLHQEVTVLRQQVRLLLDERTDADKAEELVSVAAVSEAAEHKGRPAHAKGPAAAAFSNGPEKRGIGASAALVAGIPAVLGVLFLVIAWLSSTGSVSLTYDSGRKPASVEGMVRPGAGEGPHYIWDVAESVKSVFRPSEDDGVDQLLGDLTVAVPQGCTDRTVEWEIALDGKKVSHGSLTGKTEHQVPIERDLEQPPKRITIEASWDGLGGACESFGLVWTAPRLSESFGLALW
ncbi:caspase family protein [Streptomyces sp. NPDC048057]|uniref:caspase family protein n=1 Tax=Streptomyces sp. NPDC048057 TaxID=3155628 RepID=UPI0033C4DEF8